MLSRTYSFQLCAWLGLVVSCGIDSAVIPTGSGGGASASPDGAVVGDAARPPQVSCAYAQIVCDGTKAKVCDGQGGFTNETDCASECQPGLGCVHCMPNTGSCDAVASQAKVCDPTGSREVVFHCGGWGMTCNPDGCSGPCSPTQLGPGYQGCEFWPTVTANRVWTGSGAGPGFHFGVLLGNPSTSRVDVEITGGDDPTVSLTLEPGEAREVKLDWASSTTMLKGSDWASPFVPASSVASVSAPNAAYRITSKAPIVAYQFNPIEDKLVSANGCPALPGGNGGCYSYSTDASLLIPAHVLGTRYVATGYHAWHQEPFPRSADNRLAQGDFLAITATQPGPGTDVTIALREGQTVLSGPNTPAFGSSPETLTLSAGQVLQLFTAGRSGSDTFSGTSIMSSRPIQVLSGVGCASIPQDNSPCGHVEDPVLPLQVLGKDYVLPTLHAPSGASLPRSIRVQAVSDGTAITFTPTTLNNVTLNKGEALDIPDVTVNVSISSTVPFAVTEYLNGRGQINSGASDGQNVAGPAQWSVPPTSQFRTDYVFMASPSFEVNVVSITAPTGAVVMLDDARVPPDAFVAVSKSGMSVVRRTLSNNGQVHRLHSDKPAGIAVYGFSPFTNYMVSGGLDFRVDPAVAR
jgi:hypothetical protein